MASRKAGLLASLKGEVVPGNDDLTLPNPSTRTFKPSIVVLCHVYVVHSLINLTKIPLYSFKGVKRKLSSIADSTLPSNPSASSNSFALIMKDPLARIETSPVKKKPKILEFQASHSSISSDLLSTLPSPSIPFKFKERLLSESVTKDYLRDLDVLQLGSVAEKARHIRRMWRSKGAYESNFVVVGVVCHVWNCNVPLVAASTLQPATDATLSSSDSASKAAPSGESDTRTGLSNTSSSPTDHKMLIVRLSDLQRTSVSLVIQPSLVTKLSLSFGSIVLILNPKFLTALDGEGILLTIEKETQVCVVGSSSEIGLCSYRQPVKRVEKHEISLKAAAASSGLKGVEKGEVVTKELESINGGGAVSSAKAEAVCPNFVNVLNTDYCEYHMFELVRQSKSQRMVLNDAGVGALGSKALKKEFASAAKHLSDGLFSLFDSKWRVSERGVKLTTPNDAHLNGPSATQMYVLHQHNKPPFLACCRAHSTPAILIQERTSHPSQLPVLLALVNFSVGN